MQDDSGYRKRAQELGPHVDEMILKLLARGEGFIDTRKIWGILSLDKRYTAGQIDAACGRALDFGSVGFRVVKSFLDREEMAAMVQYQHAYEAAARTLRIGMGRFTSAADIDYAAAALAAAHAGARAPSVEQSAQA